jgi:hypothetical protein
MLSIKRHGSFGPRIVWDKHIQNNMIGKYHGPERQDVWTNGRDKNAWNSRMHDRSTGRHAVGGGSSGSGENDTVRLDRRQVYIVTKAFQGCQVRAAPPIDHDLVKDIVPSPHNSFSIDNATFQSHANG